MLCIGSLLKSQNIEENKEKKRFSCKTMLVEICEYRSLVLLFIFRWKKNVQKGNTKLIAKEGEACMGEQVQSKTI